MSPGPQTSKMDRFLTIANGLKLLTFVAKLSILDICGSPGYASEHGRSSRQLLASLIWDMEIKY